MLAGAQEPHILPPPGVSSFIQIYLPLWFEDYNARHVRFLGLRGNHFSRLPGRKNLLVSETLPIQIGFDAPPVPNDSVPG